MRDRNLETSLGRTLCGEEVNCDSVPCTSTVPLDATSPNVEALAFTVEPVSLGLCRVFIKFKTKTAA